MHHVHKVFMCVRLHTCACSCSVCMCVAKGGGRGGAGGHMPLHSKSRGAVPPQKLLLSFVADTSKQLF